jgi:[ribosomal protein S18]-alanine N-acetyltransferase
MNAILKPIEAGFEPMTASHLPAIMAVERRAYAYPWTQPNFMDALCAGNQAQLLVANEVLLGYFVAMRGVDEVHLLNITVAPEHQRQGWARTMMDALALWSRGQGAQWLWLEVRASNVRAEQVYLAHGYRRVGLRKAYYPNGERPREDAIVMNLKL